MLLLITEELLLLAIESSSSVPNDLGRRSGLTCLKLNKSSAKVGLFLGNIERHGGMDKLKMSGIKFDLSIMSSSYLALTSLANKIKVGVVAIAK